LVKTGATANRESAADSERQGCKCGFGRLIDLARIEPVAVTRHERPVVVVLSVEEYKQLQSLGGGQNTPGKRGTE